MDPIRGPHDELDARTMTPPTAAEASAHLAFASKPLPMTPPRVLVVDDDAGILDLLEMLFTDDGFHPVCCGTSEAARAALAAEPVQLVVTDLRLVGGTSLDLLCHIRTRCPDLPSVIVLTAAPPAHAAPEVEQIAQLGARIIAKPFDIDDLLGTARALTGWPGRSLP